MRSLFLFGLFLATQSFGQQADILIKNGKILDGTGNSWFYGDIAVLKEKIVAVGKLAKWTAPKTIDAINSGKINGVANGCVVSSAGNGAICLKVINIFHQYR